MTALTSDMKIAVMGAAGRMGREFDPRRASDGRACAAGRRVSKHAGSSATRRGRSANLAGLGKLGILVTSDALGLIDQGRRRPRLH